MSFLQIIIEAFRSLSANRLRTALTMLGIIIGIASVVLMLAVGDAVRNFIDGELSVLGSNQLIVQPGTRTQGGVRRRSGELPTLTIDDVLAIDQLPSVKGATPMLQGYFQINYGTDNSNSLVFGVTENVMRVRNWKIEQGVGFAEADIRAGTKVMVIGSAIASQYFYKQNPIGKTIRVEGRPFTVIGVLAGGGRQLDGSDLGEMLLTPITAIPVTMPAPRTIHYAIVQARDGQSLGEADADIKDILRDRHRITGDKTDDFQITNLASIAQTGAAIGTGLSVALGVIGAISLLVGGIGIMNIMLVSVSERVREIGIRMAIGAKPIHVLMQFLAEAVAMCIVSGIIGIGLAMLTAWGINKADKITMVLSTQHVLIAVLFSTAVGLFFGFYPARRASRLSPIECLRQD